MTNEYDEDDDDIGCLTKGDMEFMAKMFWGTMLFYLIVLVVIGFIVYKVIT